MNPSQVNSRECLQQAIDVEIKSLEESIRVLKSHRNALSPVSSLPPEVFGAIFSLLCLPGNGVPGGKPDLRLHISHVCHQWREIALNRPLLWSRIDFTSLRLAGTVEILSRAKSVPLYLKANLSSNRPKQFNRFRKELQARIPDICHLRISAKPDLLHRTLKRLTSPAPNLEYLTLSSCIGHVWSTKSGRSSIPNTLFGSRSPRLSYLELCDCNISWRSPLLKGLKHLNIMKPSANSRPELAVWLSALDEMPQLTTLTLHLASPISPSFLFDVNRTATLPSLTHLDLLSLPEDCALALAHLNLPALTSLRLTVQLLDTSDVQRLLPFVVRHVHGPQDAQPLQCVLICSKWDVADILAWPMPNIDAQVMVDPLTLLPATLPTRVSLSFSGRDDEISPEERLDILETVLAGLPLDDLVVLAAHELSNDHDLETQGFWDHLCPKWHLLQCVLLSDPAADGFFAMLEDDDEDEDERESLLLPLLSQLVLVNYPFDPLISLYEALYFRKEQGLPVKKLDLRMCNSDLLIYELVLPAILKLGLEVLGPEKNFDVTRSRLWTEGHDFCVDNDHSATGSDDEGVEE